MIEVTADITNLHGRVVHSVYGYLYCADASSLSTASRFVWLGLLQLAHDQGTDRVEGSVKGVCSQLGVCDKALVMAVAELEAAGLLRRVARKTTLGANSYLYIPRHPLADGSLPVAQLSNCVREVLYRQRPFQSKVKLNVNQRLLLIMVLMIYFEDNIIMRIHTDKLSFITGIPSRNIEKNLFKMKMAGLLESVRISTWSSYIRSKRTFPAWAYMPAIDLIDNRNEIVFNEEPDYEVQAVTLLKKKEEWIKYVEKPSFVKAIPIQKIPMRWTRGRIFRHFESPFSTVPTSVRKRLLDAIDAVGKLWVKLGSSGFHFELNAILQLAAVHFLKRADDEGIVSPYEFIDCPKATLKVQQLVQLFPIPTQQKSLLVQLCLPLCLMRARSLKNSIDRAREIGNINFELSGKQFYVRHVTPTLMLYFNCPYEPEVPQKYFFPGDIDYSDPSLRCKDDSTDNSGS